MKQLVLRNKIIVAGIVAGAVAGFFYWKYVGCLTGTCMITGKALNSSIYFAVMGALVAGIFKKQKQADGGK